MQTHVQVHQPQDWHPQMQEAVHLAIPVENAQISGYQQQVMMPADQEWQHNMAPVLVSEKDMKKMDEVEIAQPVFDPNQMPGVSGDQPPAYSEESKNYSYPGYQDQMQYPNA